MNTLYIPIGISGSGKTRYGNSLKNVETICPDDLRKELLGDISDQSNGSLIFNEYHKRLTNCAKQNKDVYASATHLKLSYIKDTIKSYSIKPFNLVFILFEDSLDWKTCYERVKNDIKNNVDRAKVPDNIIRTQSERYKIIRNLILSNSVDFNDPNIQSIKIVKK